jgi:hypothetical protein
MCLSFEYSLVEHGSRGSCGLLQLSLCWRLRDLVSVYCLFVLSVDP